MSLCKDLYAKITFVEFSPKKVGPLVHIVLLPLCLEARTLKNVKCIVTTQWSVAQKRRFHWVQATLQMNRLDGQDAPPQCSPDISAVPLPKSVNTHTVL